MPLLFKGVQCFFVVARVNPQTMTLVMATVGEQKTGGGFAVGVGFQG